VVQTILLSGSDPDVIRTPLTKIYVVPPDLEAAI
jgi:hypothetical protein